MALEISEQTKRAKATESLIYFSLDNRKQRVNKNVNVQL